MKQKCWIRRCWPLWELGCMECGAVVFAGWVGVDGTFKRMISELDHHLAWHRRVVRHG